MICVGAAYFLALQIAFLYPEAEKVLAAIWPAAGVGLAALVLSPTGRWMPLLAVIFIVGNVTNLLAGRPFIGSLGFMTANVLESLGCATVIRFACGERVTFRRLREVEALIAGALIVNSFTSVIGAGTARLVSDAAFWSFYKTWWVADGLGILLITPVLVSLSVPPDSALGARPYARFRSFAFYCAWTLLAYTSFMPGAIPSEYTLPPYVFYALIVWPALRFGTRETAMAILAVAIFRVLGLPNPNALADIGAADPVTRLLLAQLYVAVLSITGLLLAASYTETRAAEVLAREDETRIRALGDNLPNGMVYQAVRDHDGRTRFVYVSAGVVRLNALSAEEVLRNPDALYDLILEEDRPAVAAAAQASAEALSVFNETIRFRLRDGRIRWMHFTSTPRRLPDGRILWDGIQTDITERKENEEALRAAFEDIRTLRGIVPICAGCKKIRDDQGYWNQVEIYLRDHSEAEFSHSICPECAVRLYPEYSAHLKT